MFSLELILIILIVLLVIICVFNWPNEITMNRIDQYKNRELTRVINFFTNSENKKSNLIKVYNFNTSWCGYSVRFQPEWDKFKKEINSIDNLHVEAYDIKCNNTNNKQMCNDYDIAGFPTVIIEKDGEKINYNGPRTADAIIETITNL